ncbi:hypothetical protein IJGMMPBP_00067 [Infectious spleen and kidney necrosis virus]|uniref:Ig-like domain-containing protein n=1 Tax=Infectious spleen and kidney necrosis virus TaxID=180170 RepID=A0A7U1GHV4_ISKNV|nr:hypothetical protein IJGMMPBP_00067 [Infectious spleen and kidney necrosis virus]QQZ00615.1 hypothetical protein NIDBEMMG_00040 [Infectious spleen and kidney necrosis virus]UWH19825.1 ORF066 [Infectious spleen and kidney necrosis virus]
MGTATALLLCLVVCAHMAYAAQVTYTMYGTKGVALSCPAERNPNVTYMAVTWYKQHNNSLRGLMSRRLYENDTMRYFVGAPMDMTMLPDDTLVLDFALTCNWNGTYICRLSAPVGERNVQSSTELYVVPCMPPPVEPLPQDISAVVMFPVNVVLVVMTTVCAFIALSASTFMAVVIAMRVYSMYNTPPIYTPMV